MKYTHEEERYLSNLFRRIDARVGRLHGLKNARSLVRDYYSGDVATMFEKVIGGMIREEYERERALSSIKEEEDRLGVKLDYVRSSWEDNVP